MAVVADTEEEIFELAESLSGNLTCTVWGNEDDMNKYGKRLLDILKDKAGRVVYNSFPTGVELCDAMIHGGPWPATSDPRMTSVGTNAIRRFTRPVCYQGWPQNLLPPPIQDANPLGIPQLVT